MAISPKDKVTGMFLGIAIGDALGMPVESFSPARILEKYPETGGRVDKYLDASGHKWFDGRKPGTWTDDTQLSLAVARSLIEAKKFDIPSQVKHHIEAFTASADGWGRSTRNSLRRLANGTNWKVSGEPGGNGNGIAMKISPLGIYVSTLSKKMENILDLSRLSAPLALMTHISDVAVCSGLSHTVATSYCYLSEPEDFDKKQFIDLVIAAANSGHEEYCAYSLGRFKKTGWELPEDKLEKLDEEGKLAEDIAKRFELLHQADKFSVEEIIENCGAGSCYAYNSLPFTYMFFLKNPTSIEPLYEVISAGGDTDSNGSMVGGLLGALNGASIFPEELVKSLDRVEEILSIADSFCDAFDIGE